MEVDDSVKQGHGARVRHPRPPACISKIAWTLLAALLLLPAPTKALAQTQRAIPGLTGTVVRVHDGDTITILATGKTEVKVRLFGIDAPEHGQPYGSAAKKSLSTLVFGREVSLHATGKDKYGRTLGHLYVGDLWVNHEQVLRGMAWHYVQYSQDAQLDQAERSARQARRGLWQDSNATPPWVWRRKIRQN